ncbi:MAG: hypothetical protein ACI9C1_003442, partial [Candidatus Aldehydirespiratoraceae bacterium]
MFCEPKPAQGAGFRSQNGLLEDGVGGEGDDAGGAEVAEVGE